MSTAVKSAACSCYTKAAGDAVNRKSDATTFSVSPEAIVFRSFKPNKLYEAVITFKNCSNKSEYIRVGKPSSHVFSLSAPKTTGTSMISSGLTISYKVRFMPDANKDYSCFLTAHTDHGEISIPLCAHADRGTLQLPENLVANPCLVKGSNSTTLFLRNGESDECIWKASVDAPFAISPAYGVVAGNGGLLPVEVHFSPQHCRAYSSTVRFFLGPEGDMVQEMPISGEGIEADIRLEPSSIEFIETYVSRERQTVVQVANNSGDTIHFSWKSDYEENEEDSAEVAEGSRNMYSDSVFSIEPCSGVIYGKGLREFTVCFNPQLAVRSTSTAYLDVVGRSQRIPLSIVGHGAGPQCKLEFTRLNIGDIFMNELHEYEIIIENTGCIEAVYTVLPPTTLMGRKFSFSPEKGVLAPAESQVLKVQLQSDLIGAINEVFPIHLHGSVTDLTMQFKGRILGPTYHFDIHELDFGNVSYNFWHSRTFYISNTSRIPMNFRLRLPEDSPYKEEFVITPSEGCIPPKHAQIVEVNFLSNTVGEYDTAILMDMVDVGDAVDCLPLKALCMVPPLHLVSERLTYGQCFVGYPYVLNLEVANDTPMCGKCAICIVDQNAWKDKVDVSIPNINDDNDVRIIEPHSRVLVPVSLCALDIGHFNFTLSLRVLGNDGITQTAYVSAEGRGPVIELSHSAVNFGKVPVLSKVTKQLTLSNRSPIPAEVTLELVYPGKGETKKLETKPENNKSGGGAASFNAERKDRRDRNADSKGSASKDKDDDFAKRTSPRKDGSEKTQPFEINPVCGTIPALGKLVVAVDAKLDAAMAFRRDIILRVKYAAKPMPPITVKAIGKGYPLLMLKSVKGEDNILKFERATTHCICKETISVYNGGNKTEKIRWLNANKTETEEGAPVYFHMEPDCAEILPSEACVFEVECYSTTAGYRQEHLYLTRADDDEPIYNLIACTQFVDSLDQNTSISGINDKPVPARFRRRRSKEEIAFAKKLSEINSLQEFVRITAEKSPLKVLVNTHDSRELDFKDIFTNCTAKEPVVIINSSPKNAEIQWLNVRGTKVKEGAPPITFHVQPERAVIAPHDYCIFEFTGFSSMEGVLEDNFYVKQPGASEPIYTLLTRGNFLAAALDFSFPGAKTIPFEFRQGFNKLEDSITKTFTVANSAKKELEVNLIIHDRNSPFSIENPSNFTLKEAETRVIAVTLRPSYRMDLVSHTAKSKILISFKDVKQTDVVNLVAKFLFPSVNLLVDTINFGTIMKDTEMRMPLVLTNPSTELPAVFSWKSINSEDAITENDESVVQNLSHKIFDFIPFKGTIPPGGQKEITAVFYGASGRHEGSAVCEVEGGPTQNLKCIGAAGEVQIHYDRTQLDFGVIPYYESATKSITITNPSHVSVNFSTTHSLKNPDCLHITPEHGTITTKLQLRVTFRPNIPDEINESFAIHVGHFDPQVVRVTGRGQLTSALLLPTESLFMNATVERMINKTFQSIYESIKEFSGDTFVPYATKAMGLLLPESVDLVALEAERQAYCASVDYFLKKKQAEDGEHVENANTLLDSRVVTDEETYPLRRQIRRSSKSAKGSVKHVLARYIINFGDMTRSEKRSTKVKLFNSCNIPIVPILDSKELVRTPLTIEPIKLPKINSLGEVELDVTLDATHAHADVIKSGENSFEFVIDLKEGPVIVLEARCYIATPSLVISDSQIDFEDILVGQCKIVPLTILNDQAVPCDWRLSCRENKLSIRKCNQMEQLMMESPQFWVDQDHGTLLPGSSQVLEVYFAPLVDTVMSASLIFRCVNNPKPFEVTLKGTGRLINVTLSPVPFEIPVVRPVQVSHQTMRITNNENYPVLLYACGLDALEQYETQLLEWCLSMIKGGRTIYPIRVAGEGLHNEILEFIYSLMNEHQLRLKYISDDITNGAASIRNQRLSRTEVIGNVVPEKVEGAPAHTEPPAVKPYMILLLGPPQSGKSAQAAMLRQKLDFISVQFDDLVEEEADNDSAMGEVIRNILSLLPLPSNMNDREMRTTFHSEPNPAAKLSEAKLFCGTMTRTLNDPFEATFTKDAPLGFHGTATSTLASARGKSKHDNNLSHANDPTHVYQGLIPNILRQLLRVFIRRCNAGTPAGYIMDDVNCCLTQDKVMLFNTVKQLCESMEIPLQVVVLAVSEPTVGLRYASSVYDSWKEAVQEAMIDPLPEDAYDAITPEERSEYNWKLKYLNECRRNLKESKKKMEKYQKTLSEGSHLSIPLEVQEHITHTSLNATGRGGKKPRQSNASFLQQAVPWMYLSPLDAFKELYTHIVKDSEEAEPESSIVHLISAEHPLERVTDVVVDKLLQNNTNEENAVEVQNSVSRHSTPKSFGTSADESRFGVWQYLDLSRLRYLMSRRSGDCIRFFSMVEREVLVVKKNAKNKQGTTTLVRRNEELTRWLIPPRSFVDVNVEFCSDRIGKFSMVCPFGVCGSLQTVELSVSTQVALPDMGREDKDIFPVTRPRLVAGRLPGKVFITSKRVYDFGPLLVPGPVGPKTRTKGKERPSSGVRGSTAPVFLEPEHRGSAEVVLGATETLTFSNSGISPAEVLLTFVNEKEKTFTVNPSRFVLEVGGTQEVTLRAAPETVGEISNRLIATVKDNPNPWQVQVSCSGSRPSLTVNNHKEVEMDFGRSVINRCDQRTLTLANASRMAIQWKIVGLERLPHDISIDETSGIIEENGVYPITITFAPTNTCLHTTPLQIYVTDPNVSSIIYEAIPIVVKAEGHDVVLEWTREVDFKLMHVGETKKETVRVMNKSPYDVSFMFRLPQRLQNMISVTPQSGTIRGMMGYKDSAIATIEVTAHFDREGEIPKRLAQLEATFFDMQENELLYPVQIIPLMGQAWYTKFSVKPDNIDFGSCFYNQRKQSTLEVRNTGRFPVNFILFDYNEGCRELALNAKANTQTETTEEQPPSTRKSTRGKHNDSDFRIGCFTISPARGTVQVGEIQTLTVLTCPQTESRTKEILGVFVEQSGPELEAHGLPIELQAQPATPGIAADLSSPSDVETIFEEQQVLFRLDTFDKGAKAFGKEDKAFSFGTVLVGHESEERFRIANSSPLPCNVMVQLQSTMSSAKTVLTPECFEIKSESLSNDKGQDVLRFTLPPFESRFVSTVFKPTSLQRYEARFVAVVENGTDPKTNNLNFNIIGMGTLPNVEYILPPSLTKPTVGPGELTTPQSMKGRTKENVKKSVLLIPPVPMNDTIEMPLTRVGATSSRYFTIRNVGGVPANIRVTLVSDEALTDGLTVMKRNMDITISVGSEEFFEVLYTPTRVSKGYMKLRVSLGDNPFEDKELIVEAQSFYQDISFDNIDPATSDFLNVGDCYLKESKTVEFGMRNNTNKDLRFTWIMPDNEKIEIAPREGHLHAHQSKVMSLTLENHKLGLNRTIPCEVQVNSIDLLENIDWDSGIVNQKWVVVDEGENHNMQDPGRRNLKKIKEPVPEPAYRLTNDLCIVQPLHVGFNCDKPTCDVFLDNGEGKTIPVESISFPRTKIFQRRIVTLRLQNTGTVALPFRFSVASKGSPSTVALPANPFNPNPTEEREFSVDIPEGTVPTGTGKNIKVIFAPTSAETLSGTLRCDFPHSDRAPLFLPLTGLGECPLVHFNIPASDYLTNRVDGETGPIVDPETVVLEFLTRGLHSHVTLKFKVINPTSLPHHFEWNEDLDPDTLSPFRCLTPSGNITAGKQTEMAFEFSANNLGLRECKWTFNLEGKAAVPFLLVGRAVEPEVFLSDSKINFGSVSLGTKAEKDIILENRDDIPFGFCFDKAVLATTPFLTVKPTQGTIGPMEKLPITVSFTPRDELEYNMPLVCAVKKASTPLTVNVKGEGFTIHETLIMEQPGEEEPLEVLRSQPLYLNLGRVQLQDTVLRRFVLTNTGHYSFEYTVGFPSRRFIQVDNVAGTVMPKMSSVITLTYSPTAEENLHSFRMIFKISDKVAYQVGVQAVSYIPKLNLSSDKFDFGPRFITAFNSGATVSAVLSILNNDKEMVTVDCSLSDSNDWCELDTSSFVAHAGDVKEITLTFCPKETRMYDDRLKLLVNGVYPIFVPISGEGVTPRVEVLNHFCKLGVARIGEKKESEMRLECRSRIPTPVSFVGCLDEDLVSKGVSITTGLTYVLKPREVRVLHVVFNPQRRMGAFQREMKMLVCNREVPFALITGSCEDSEIHLDNTSLKFSDVVVGSSSIKKIVIMNSGDISQKFVWNLRSGSEITITPSSGFVRSHTEYICEFKYTPFKAESVLQRTVSVDFDNSPSIGVTVEGNSIARPPAKGVLQFRCRAREKQELKLQVENSASQPWTFSPTIEHPFFHAPSTVTIKSRGRLEILLSYTPMKPNVGSDPDECTLFIPQADGTGQTYILEGIADEPGPAGPCVEINMEAKTTTQAKFYVKNWCKKSALRFAREIQWVTEPPEGLVVVKGQSGVDVPPDSGKDYILSFHCMREGFFRGTMIFQCVERQDMIQFYEFTLKVVSQPTTEMLKLESVVRTSAIHKIPLMNPLGKPVNVLCKLEGCSEGITVPPNISVPAKSESFFPVEFFPLVHKEYNQVKIILNSPDLGMSVYLVKPVSAPPPPEKITRLVCPIGQSVTFALRFTHYTKNNTDFSITFAGENTSTGKNAVFSKVGQGTSIKAQATSRPHGQEIVTDFVYEPQAQGNMKEIIEFTSLVGGTYTFPVMAVCTEPQRQGPFAMRPGQNTPVPFKNVFAEPVSISATTDTPHFVVTKKSESVAAKKTVNIMVQCKVDDPNSMVRGKLLISCVPPGEKKPLEWVYYLEGGSVETNSSRRSVARASSTKKKGSPGRSK